MVNPQLISLLFWKRYCMPSVLKLKSMPCWMKRGSVICLGHHLLECYKKLPWTDISAPYGFGIAAQGFDWHSSGSVTVKNISFHMVETLFFMKYCRERVVDEKRGD